MKSRYFLSYVAAASLALTACTDLDTAPGGNTVTSDMKSEVLDAMPERGEASVRAIFAQMNVYAPNYTLFGNKVRHNDFGFGSVLMFTDANTEDQVSEDNGYNWAGNDLTFNDRKYDSYEADIVWNGHYSVIFNANSVVAGYNTGTDPEDPTARFYYAQGLAARAAMYLSLAGLYQFTYGQVDPATTPCVPIITDENSSAAAVEGAPRATVAEVYAQIKKDLDHAITLLTDNSYKRPDKRYISLAVALGLRARMNLVMENWDAAASDAKAAIDEAANEGISPAEINDVNHPTFANSTEKDWMWGILIAETDDVVSSGIVNWISHCGTFNYGYGQYSGGHQISKKLYDLIPVTDVRKGWWSGADGKNTYLGEDYNAYLEDYGFRPYTNCKFGTYDGQIECDNNANDIPMMRVEEMYLILAEAKDMSNQNGRETLEKFVRDYRDPSYTCTGDVQQEVYFQKRIELWGEGRIWFDLMRLNKGIDRRGCAYPNPTSIFVIPAKDPILLWRIPQTEIEANPAISDADNNVVTDTPKAVAED